MRSAVRVDAIEDRLAVAQVLLLHHDLPELYEDLEASLREALAKWAATRGADPRWRANSWIARGKIEDLLERLYLDYDGQPEEVWPVLFALVLPEEYADIGPPLAPTEALPGSLQKEDVLRARLAEGRGLHHEFDAVAGEKVAYLKGERKQTRAMAGRRESRGLAVYRDERSIVIERPKKCIRRAYDRPELRLHLAQDRVRD